MLDCLACVITLRVGLSEKLVRLDLLCLVVGFFAELQELFAHVHSTVELTLCLVNHTDLLVTLSLDIAVLGCFGDVEAFFEKLE